MRDTQRQVLTDAERSRLPAGSPKWESGPQDPRMMTCLLYTSDAADDPPIV